MNIEKAIRKIKEFGLHHAIQDLPHSELTVKAFEMAISALEKQIPKKPKHYTDTFKITYYFCPICEYVRITGNQKRCDVCGQKIDWEVENE